MSIVLVYIVLAMSSNDKIACTFGSMNIISMFVGIYACLEGRSNGHQNFKH